MSHVWQIECKLHNEMEWRPILGLWGDRYALTYAHYYTAKKIAQIIMKEHECNKGKEKPHISFRAVKYVRAE
jgi:hypothetical protein